MPLMRCHRCRGLASVVGSAEKLVQRHREPPCWLHGFAGEHGRRRRQQLPLCQPVGVRRARQVSIGFYAVAARPWRRLHWCPGAVQYWRESARCAAPGAAAARRRHRSRPLEGDAAALGACPHWAEAPAIPGRRRTYLGSVVAWSTRVLVSSQDGVACRNVLRQPAAAYAGAACRRQKRPPSLWALSLLTLSVMSCRPMSVSQLRPAAGYY
jgi:hypothetical protein